MRPHHKLNISETSEEPTVLNGRGVEVEIEVDVEIEIEIKMLR